MRSRQKVFAVLPTLLTLGNAACGFGAITIAAKVGPENLGGNEMLWAPLLIFLGMLFDMLDGSAARLTNQTSEFGAQLDSLCDAVTFGVAPAFLMLQFANPAYHLIEGGRSAPFEYPTRLLWAIAALFVFCVLLRLARFNVETDEEDSHEYFSGLPSPAAAGVIAGFPLSVRYLKNMVEGDASFRQVTAEYLIPAVAIALPLITFSVACLMVSRFRYPHLFNNLIRGRRNRGHIIQLVFAITLIWVVREFALVLILCWFAFGIPLKSLALSGRDLFVKRSSNESTTHH